MPRLAGKQEVSDRGIEQGKDIGAGIEPGAILPITGPPKP